MIKKERASENTYIHRESGRYQLRWEGNLAAVSVLTRL
jgi:hypothetical protein